MIEAKIHNDIAPQTSGKQILHRYSMFLPINAEEVKSDYPEIRKYECFRSLYPRDIVFIWYIAHRSSPVFGWELKVKTDFAIRRAYKNITDDKYKKLIAGEYTEEFREAIEQMKSFQPNVRARLNAMNEKILASWEKIANREIPDDILNDESKMSLAKQYVEATNKIRAAMPGLLSDIEKNYSISINHDAMEEGVEVSYLDSYHDEKTSKKAV